MSLCFSLISLCKKRLYKKQNCTSKNRSNMEVRGVSKFLPLFLCSLGFKSSFCSAQFEKFLKSSFSLVEWRNVISLWGGGEGSGALWSVGDGAATWLDDVLWFNVTSSSRDEISLDRGDLFIVLTVQPVRGDADAGRSGLSLPRQEMVDPAHRPGTLKKLAPLQSHAVLRGLQVRVPGQGGRQCPVRQAQVSQRQPLVAWRGGRGSSEALIFGRWRDAVHYQAFVSAGRHCFVGRVRALSCLLIGRRRRVLRSVPPFHRAIIPFVSVRQRTRRGPTLPGQVQIGLLLARGLAMIGPNVATVSRVEPAGVYFGYGCGEGCLLFVAG